MTPDAKGVLCVAATGSKKIDTVAAELVPRKRRAASVLNSRRRILRKFRNTTWEAFDGEVLGFLE
jgi:hypothetical protein